MKGEDFPRRIMGSAVLKGMKGCLDNCHTPAAYRKGIHTECTQDGEKKEICNNFYGLG